MIDFNYTLFIQFINFIVVLILLNTFLFKPVLRALDRRHEAMDAGSEKAKEVGDVTKQLESAYDESLREQRRPIIDARDAILADAHGSSMKTIEEARNELAGELIRIRGEIARDSQKAFQDLRKDVDRLSVEAAEKIVGRSL